MVVKTLESTPKDATHWSTRSMAREVGLTQSAVHRIWKAFGLQAHRQETWKLSRDPAHPAGAVPVAPSYRDRGRPPKARYPDPPGNLRDLVLQAGRGAARPMTWREGDRGPLTSRFVCLRVRPANDAQRGDDGVLPERWLVAEWPAGKNEPVKYWLSNLPADTQPVRLVALAKLRWRIEHDYRELKQCLGLDHYEGRSYRGLHHHLTCVTVAHAFLTCCRLSRAGPHPARPQTAAA